MNQAEEPTNTKKQVPIWVKIIAIIVIPSVALYFNYSNSEPSDFEKIESKLQVLDERIVREELWLNGVNESNPYYANWSFYIFKADQYRNDAAENWSNEDYANAEYNINLAYNYLNKLPKEPATGSDIPLYFLALLIILLIIILIILGRKK